MSDRESTHHAERALIGGILICCEEAPPPVLDMLHPDDFADKRLGVVFAAILMLYGREEPIDLTTVHAALAGTPGPKPGWGTFLADITETAITAANLEHYAELVRKDARRRDCVRVMRSGLKQAQHAGADGDEVIAEAVRDLGALAESRSLVKPVSLGDLVVAEYKALDQRRNGGAVVGLPSGFGPLDRCMGGMQPGGLVVIAARPAMGKSSLATNILTDVVVRQGKRALLFSLEMTRDELAQRILAAEAKVDLNRIRTGRLSSDECNGLSESIDTALRTERLAIVDKPGLSVAELRAIARQYAARHTVDVIAVDYLQLMEGTGDTREQEVASISRGLKALAMELRVPVIALSQLSRAVEQRPDKRPILSDLRESGSIEQEAHQVIFIYRDDYYKPKTEEPGIAEIAVAKNRNGPTGMIKLRWLSRTTRFLSLEHPPRAEQAQQVGLVI